MLRTEALRILGLKEHHDEQELLAAFRDAVKANHTDHGGDGTKIAKLTKAKAFLADRFKVVELPLCGRCNGKGVIKGLSKFGSTCKACQGSGKETRNR